MAKYKIIKLTSMSPLHIGTGRENYDFSSSALCSDTLSSAIASIRARNGGDKDTLEFMSSFSMSSAFPYFGDRMFLPLPKGRVNVTVKGKEEHEYRKALKKVRYAETSLWSSLSTGVQLSVDAEQLQGEFMVEGGGDVPVIYKKQVSQRVSVPRNADEDSSPFFFEWMYLNKDCGLYCIVDADDSLFAEIKGLFTTLGEIGIGTDKSVGGGKFDVEEGMIELSENKDPNASVVLSLYLPKEEELKFLDLPQSRYSMLLRGGYIAGSGDLSFRHLRKKSVYMFDVGSVFQTTEKIEGKVEDVTPQLNNQNIHKVYRSGKPIVVPIKIS